MSTRPWWETAVIYQIYPRSFQDSNGDGIGDLNGITARLNHLTDTLGIDAIWLSPFYRSPMSDFGYDVSDYTDVDPIFGTLDDFDRLIAAVHDRGLKLIVDFVPNHTSDQHRWFQESRASRDNPKRDWYVWRDPAPDGGPPNNWLSNFGGRAWTLDERTGQYYLHSFLKTQPDLNWRNREVEAAMHDVLRFWMDRGVDGFRMDVAHFIMKDPELRDNPPNPTPGAQSHKDLGAYDTQLHVHSKGHPDVHPTYRRVRQLLETYDPEQPRLAIGEIHIFDWPEWVTYYGEQQDEFHMPFNFALLKAPWTAAGLRAVVDGLEGALPEGAWPNYVLGNHDEKRIATRLGGRTQARQAALLLLTLRGTPTLYYGDELGLFEADIPPELQQDPWGLQVPGLGRDGCRTPMPWTDGPTAGFSDADPDDLWLPPGDGRPDIHVEAQQQDETSMLHLYQQMLALRRTSPALQVGTYTPLDGPADVFAFRRDDPASGDHAFAAFNLSDTEVTLTLPDDAGAIALSTHLDREEEASEPLTLRPWEAVVLH